MDRRKFLSSATVLPACDWIDAFATLWSCVLPTPAVTVNGPKRIVEGIVWTIMSG